MLLKLAAVLPCLLAITACDRQPAASLPQRAYVWQREWTPAVSAAVTQASPRLAGLIIFGAEITWRDGKIKPVHCLIDWKTLRELHKPVAIAMRIAPWPGPFDNASSTEELVKQAKALLQKAELEKVECAELQIDFDCAQRKLEGYALWLKALRSAVKPVRLVITALPAWLDEKALPALLVETDGWVLQVHSAMPEAPGAQVATCDPERARRWVAKAVKLHRPFEVALSTYSAQAGYAPDGKLVGLALDGIQPSWPAGTRIMQFDSDAAALTQLTNEWQALRPTGMQGILWYRLPVATDQRNWRWPTFAAVIEGRPPSHHLSVRTEGEELLDLSVVNDGEADEDLKGVRVRVTWEGAGPLASEALPGWTLNIENSQSLIISSLAQTQRLPPGAHRSMGWLRFDHPTLHRVEIVR
ncbi:MAG: hypothetical protein JWO94_3876 [Verrucomicrobiaceae bacterium]|nr:hypothetical protein [Verrucomicrobiaceae bacterium]